MKFSGIDKVIIYGSRAKGNYKNGSDIDLTIIGQNLGLENLNMLANKLDDLLLPHTFDLSIYDQISNQDFIDHIKRVGQVFWKRD